MAAPLLIAAGVATVGALAQLYISEKARGAERKRLDEIEALYNKVKPPNYDLSINEPPELHEQALALPKFSDPKQAPKWNLEKLTPEDMKLVGKYVPQLAPTIQEAAPQVLTKTQDMKTGRAAQLAALRRLQEIGSSDFDPQYQEQVQRAARAAQGEAQSRQASIMQDFARRGIAGSGLNLASQMGAASQSMDRAAQINQAAAVEAYKNRLNALMSGANLGSQISQEDTQFQDRNAGIINAFNERVSRNRQAQENQNAALLNTAQQYNLGLEQELSNLNIGARNRAAEMQQRRQDDATRYNSAFDQAERNRQDQNAMWGYGQKEDQRKYLNTLIAGRAQWKAGEKDRINNLKQRGFQDLMDINRAKTGVSSMRTDAEISGARDRNSVIQGLSNAALTGGMAYQNQQDANRNQLRQADMTYMGSKGRWMTPQEREAWKASYEDY